MANDITKLKPELQTLVKKLLEKCELSGLKIKITECVRSVAEQDALYAKGRTTSGSIVTNAKGSSYSSMHQWGVAFDFCRNDGKGAYDDSDGFFTKVGKIGVALGLEWGGNWKSIVDKPHFQLPDWGSTTTKLKAAYGTPDKFFATWGSNVLKYRANVFGDVWTDWVENGASCGITGQRMEAITIKAPVGMVLTGSAYVSDLGWLKSVSGNEITIGLTGNNKWIEAIKLSCNAKGVSYRVYSKPLGKWSDVQYQTDGVGYAGTIEKSAWIDKVKISL